MRVIGLVVLCALGAGLAEPCAAEPAELPALGECVVLLHGLARSDRSMRPLRVALGEAGFDVVNVDYPSRDLGIAELAKIHVGGAVEQCPETSGAIHFVTHSLGGILVRAFLAESEARPSRLGRVVMLAPPNQGSEIVDAIGDSAILGAALGPAGRALGTDPNSVPMKLGPVDYPVGVITGDYSSNPITSSMIPGRDDGKVAVARAKVEGMADFLVVPRTHTLIMRAPEVHTQVLHFIRRGVFARGRQP